MPRFFEPTPAFFAWAKKFLRNSFVFEVGAGDGHTSEGLREIGIAGIGLDLFPEGKTIRGDGTCYPYIAATAVMLCRPCHGDFVWLTIQYALSRGVTTFVYVGLAKNRVRDLGSYRKHFRLMLSDAGSDGEKVWVWDMRPRRDHIRAVLVRTVTCGKASNSWYEDGGDRWINQAGGYRPKDPADEVLEEAEVIDGDWQSLDWTRTSYYRETGDYGWLSPEGRFYACDYAEHGDLAYYIIKKDVGEMEESGWVRVDGPGDGSKNLDGVRSTFRFMAGHAWNGGKKLTEEQVSWLKSHGHEIDPWMLASPLADDKARAAQYIQHAEELTGKKIRKTYDGD